MTKMRIICTQAHDRNLGSSVEKVRLCWVRRKESFAGKKQSRTLGDLKNLHTPPELVA